MNKLHLTLRIIKALFHINKFNNTRSSYHRISRRLTENIFSIVNLENAHQIPANAKLKMQWYMADCLFACEQFKTVVGKPILSQNHETYLLSGALLTLCDMIIDDVEMDMERIQLLKQPTENFTPKDEVEKLYLHCYQLFFNSIDNRIKQRTKHYFELVFDAQVKSKEQFNPEISREEVDAICKAKCGYCSLVFRSLVSIDFDEHEEAAWFELGGFVQYCNDSQDLHKDLKNKIRTFASTRPNIALIKKDLAKEKEVSYSLLRSAPYNKKKIDDFLLVMDLGYFAILAKLEVFLLVTKPAFSFENFLSVDSKFLRKRTTPLRLLPFVLSKTYSLY